MVYLVGLRILFNWVLDKVRRFFFLGFINILGLKNDIFSFFLNFSKLIVETVMVLLLLWWWFIVMGIVMVLLFVKVIRRKMRRRGKRK